MDTRCPTKKLVLIIQNGSKQIDIKPDSFGFNQDKSRNKRGFSFKIVCLQQENKKHTNQMKSQEHPFAQFHFCPKCGSAEFEIHNEKSRHCRACGFTYYFNPSAATVGIIVNERRELLVCRRAKDPAKGTLDLPGGFCDCQETGEEGIIREVKEETGLDVCHTKYLFSLPNTYLYSGFLVHTLDLFFQCKIHSDEKPHGMDDVAETFWLSIDRLNPDDFGLESVKRGIRKIIEEKIV